MNELVRDARLRFPFAAPPGPGEAIEVATGILWARLPLPFALDHVTLGSATTLRAPPGTRFSAARSPAAP